MIELKQGDCLELMKDIPGSSIDLILQDPPYNTTNCHWEWDIITVIDEFWLEWKRIIKPNGAIVMFGTEPFSSKLRCSNLSMYKYDWVWQKDKATNHLNSKKQPMRKNEIISVFYQKQCIYNPHLTNKETKNIRTPTTKRKQADNYGKMTAESVREIPITKSYPNETLHFRACFGDKGKSLHPTQKPVPLLEYLIKTYTNEGETVFDGFAGSASTGVACINTNRNFIGIEKDEKYFKLATERLNNTTLPVF